ncbi:MAG: hypothetical protein ABI671_03015 [Burkholderiales bacterium]
MNTLITPLPMQALPMGAQGSGRFARIGASFWKWLEEVGQARARRELMSLAAMYETNQPELAKELRAACERIC